MKKILKKELKKTKLTRSLNRSLWLELEPWGVSVGADEPRPSMLFRVIGSEQVVPIFISPGEAAVMLSRNQAQQSSPHGAALISIDNLGYKASECRFIEMQGHHVFVEVTLAPVKKGKRKQVIKARADQALSFCLESGVKFLCQESLLRQMRDLKLDMDALGNAFMGSVQSEKTRPLYLN